MKIKIIFLCLVSRLNLFASDTINQRKYNIFAPIHHRAEKLSRAQKKRGRELLLGELSLDQEIAIFMQESSNLNPLNSEGFYLLETILQENRLDLLQKFIDEKVDLGSTDDLDQTPLFLATGFKKYQAMQMLIAAGAQVNHEKLLISPLHFALAKSSVDVTYKKCAKILISSGAILHETEVLVSENTQKVFNQLLNEIDAEAVQIKFHALREQQN